MSNVNVVNGDIQLATPTTVERPQWIRDIESKIPSLEVGQSTTYTFPAGTDKNQLRAAPGTVTKLVKNLNTNTEHPLYVAGRQYVGGRALENPNLFLVRRTA